MRALDPWQVHEPGRTADQGAAGEDQFRDRLQPALVDRARTVGDALAALEIRTDRGVLLEALELLERRQVRVRVIEMNDEADRDLVVLEVIHERAAAGVRWQRPALRMQHQARA